MNRPERDLETTVANIEPKDAAMIATRLEYGLLTGIRCNLYVRAIRRQAQENLQYFPFYYA
uniref:Uncharacterized protein n=1 Tax=Romanomermis culicivorax TaxID=13658 RepID=A0A915K7B3_ROMCU